MDGGRQAPKPLTGVRIDHSQIEPQILSQRETFARRGVEDDEPEMIKITSEIVNIRNAEIGCPKSSTLVGKLLHVHLCGDL